MVKLTKFLTACDVPLNLDSYKVHLATGKEYPPIDAFFEGKFKEWQENQSKRNFQRDHIVSLIKLKKHTWLFAGVYKVLGYEERKGRIYYFTELVENQEDLIGRVVVHYERAGKQSYLNGNPDGGEFYVTSITERKVSVREFPGYNSVIIDYRTLKIIIDSQTESWKGALSNIKGVYLITDTSTGNLYVGKAVGKNGIWQRWGDYATNGHGGNEKLIQLLQKDPEYQDHFQYTILEISDSKEHIEEREAHWKKVFKSIEHGLNAN